MSKQTFKMQKISFHVINEAVYVRLGFLQTASVVVNEGGVPTLKLRSGSLAVCCNSCLMAKYRLNRPFGPLGIVYCLELKGSVTLCYANEN